MYVVKMSGGGRVVVPAEARRALGISEGETLVGELRDGEFVLTTKRARMEAAVRHFTVRRDEPLKPAGDEALARELRQAARQLLDAGCDVIHLFHGGPDVSALIAGAELSNGPRVMLYHFDQRRYLAFGPMEPLRGSD